MKRPICQYDHCGDPAHNAGRNAKTGETIWRKSRLYGYLCGYHHTWILAERAGFETVNDYINSKSPHLKHRKDYCENINSFLGFKCTTTIFWKGMLDVDHKNGDPTDNRKRNLRTLCKCCHAYKTNKNKDYLTPGRKSMKM